MVSRANTGNPPAINTTNNTRQPGQPKLEKPTKATGPEAPERCEMLVIITAAVTGNRQCQGSYDRTVHVPVPTTLHRPGEPDRMIAGYLQFIDNTPAADGVTWEGPGQARRSLVKPPSPQEKAIKATYCSKML